MSTGDHSSIKHWPEDERPRKRLIKYGEDKLSDANLLGIPIGSGDRQTRKNAVDLSRDLLTAFGSLRYLDQATVNELCEVRGIGTAKAAQIKAALEIGKRMFSQSTGEKIKMRSSRDFFELFSPLSQKPEKGSGQGRSSRSENEPDQGAHRLRGQLERKHRSFAGSHDSRHQGIGGGHRPGA